MDFHYTGPMSFGKETSNRIGTIEYVRKSVEDAIDGELDVVVAGGAVRDAIVDKDPKDVDVFLLCPDWDTYISGDVAQRLPDKLRDSDVYLFKTPSQPPHAQLLGNTHITVGTTSLITQIILSPRPTLDDLLDGFDWNICLFGWDGMHIVMGADPSVIGAKKSLKLHNSDLPLNTLRRGFRFADKFKMILPDDVIIELCRQIVQNGTPESDGLALSVLGSAKS